MIKLTLASRDDLRRMQATVTAHHYLHRPVDARCSVEAYTVSLDAAPVGLLIFGRPEATRCGNWYGGVTVAVTATTAGEDVLDAVKHYIL